MPTAEFQRVLPSLLPAVVEGLSESIIISQRVETAAGRDNLIRWANRGTEEILGRPISELLDHSAREIYAPQDRARLLAHLRPSWDKVLAGEDLAETLPITVRLQAANGLRPPATITYRIVKDRSSDPPTIYTIGLARVEITAAELRQLHELIEAMEIAYFKADAEGRTTFSNQVESDITGYTPDELKGLKRREFYFEEGAQGALFEDAHRNSGKVTGRLIKGKKKDGSPFWGLCDVRVATEKETGQRLGTEGFYRDVSDRIELQAFLNADTKRIIPDSELLDRLEAEAGFHRDYMSSVGHQILGPLSSLVGTLRNLENHSLEEIKDRLPWIIGQTQVATRLVRNLSYMDRVLRGEAIKRRPVPLAKLAIETKLDFAQRLEEKRLHCVVDDESMDRYLVVQGDLELLRQVLVNLLDNAVKYSFPGTTIRMHGMLWPEGPCLDVCNLGLPIPPEAREKIFERRYRTAKARMTVPDGTGMGLWLVRKILEAHDAKIRCLPAGESQRKNTVFRLDFPPSRRVERTGDSHDRRRH